MGIESAFSAKTKDPTDPKVAREKSEEDDTSYYEKKVRSARAKREFEAEEREARKAQERENAPPEPPIQIKPFVFDPQAQQSQLQETIAKIQEDSKKEIEALKQSNEDYRAQVQRAQIDMVEKVLTAKMDALTKALAENLTKPQEKNLSAQVDDIIRVATTLGFSKGDSQGTPPEIRLAIAKMDIENTQAGRKFEWDKMMSERTWLLELKKLEASNSQAAAQIQSEKEKRGMWATPFESIGVAIARGLMDSGGTIGSEAPKKRKRSEFRLQAGEGESGEVECPECKQPIAIAPTARTAICPSCEASVSITRLKEGATGGP